MPSYQLTRNYRTHRSFVPSAISYIEKKPHILENIVSYMAVKHVIKSIKPDIFEDKTVEVYLHKLCGTGSIGEEFYNYFLNKGLSQSEITHRLKRIKFLKLIRDDLYIIPTITLITNQQGVSNNIEILEPITFIEQPIEQTNMAERSDLTTFTRPTGHISQAFIEFSKIAKHSGLSVTKDNDKRIFSGNGYKLILGYSVDNNVILRIEKDNSNSGELIPYELNKNGNFDHIIFHTFGEFSYLMKQAGFVYDKPSSNKDNKIYKKGNSSIQLKWENGFTKLSFTNF